MKHSEPFREISRDQLLRLLETAYTQPATITTLTQPRVRKRGGNPYLARGVQRRSVRNGFIGPNYESVVNRQRAREATRKRFPLFVAEKLWGGAGRRLPGNQHIVQHAGTKRLYLVFFPQRMMLSRYEYSDTGRKIPDARIKPWLIEKKAAPSAHQGTKKPIEWRLFALDNLQAIKFGGCQYLIAGHAEDSRSAAA